MPTSCDVNLPMSHVARFPHRCVVCGDESPSSRVTLVTGSIGWWTWLFSFLGKPFSVKAPACGLCAWSLHARRLAGLIVTVGVVVAVLWFAGPMVVAQVPHSLRKWVFFGLTLVGLLPQILFEVFFPPPFNLTAFSDSVDYEFRNTDLAGDFAALNLDAEWVKINDIALRDNR